MLLKELFLKEEDQSTAVFAFGRFNPPTKGHEKLIQKVRSVAQKMDAKPYVFLSHSQDKKNPLSYEEKLNYIKSTGRFNDIEFGFNEVSTIVQALQKLMNEGRTRVVIVAGSDRVDYFKNFMNQYNKKNDKAGNLVFDFDYTDAVSSGDRDPDAEGVAGVSASQARAYAANDDYEGFKQVVMDNSEELVKSAFARVQSMVGKKVAVNNERLYNEADMAQKKPTVYLDMDGVIADFFGGVEQMYGVKHWKELTSVKTGGELKQEVIDRITGSDFFSTLPKFTTTESLIDIIKKFTGGKFSILTSPLRGDHDNSAKWKKVWINQNIEQPQETIVTGRKEKYAVTDGVQNILIDDRPVNIERWQGRGGYGILYQANRDPLTKVEQALKQYGEKNAN
jgi:phosphopantetheine adenylyltransferase